MGHKNYSNFSKHSNKTGNKVFIKESEVKEIQGVNEVPEEAEVIDEAVIVPDNNLVNGYVIGCDKLNVRKEDNKDSEVLCVINKSAEVKVNIAESTIYFYKVYTASGVEGYCMKEYISVK